MAGKTINPAVLIAGDDEYAKAKKAEELLALLFPSPGSKDLNFEEINCSKLTADIFIDFNDKLRTAPFLAEKRVLVLRRFEDLYIENHKALLKYLEAPSDSSCLILISKDNITKNDFIKKKTYSEISRFTENLLCFVPYDDNFRPKVLEAFRRAGKSINEEAVAVLLERVNGNLRELESEVEKVLVFTGKKAKVELADVKFLVSDTDVNEVFDLCNALIGRDFVGSMKIVNNLYFNARPEAVTPMILGTLYYSYQRLWMTKQYLKEGLTDNMLAGKLRLPPFMVKRAADQSRSISEPEIKKALNVLQKADISVKTGGLPGRFAVERIVYNLTAF